MKDDATDVLMTVDFDTTDALSTAKKLDKEVKRIFDSRDGQQSSALTSLEVQMKQNIKNIDILRERLSTMPSAKVPTTEYANLKTELEQVTAQYEKLRAQQDKKFKLYKELDDLENQYENVSRTLAQLTNQYNALSEGLPLTQEGSWEREHSLDMMYSLNVQIQGLTQNAKELEAALRRPEYLALTKLDQDALDASERVSTLQRQVKSLEDTGKAYKIISPEETEEGKKIVAQIDTADDKLKQLIVHHNEILSKEHKQVDTLSTTRQIVAQLRRTFSGVLGIARRFLGTLLRINKHSARTHFSFKRLFRVLLKYGLGVRSFFILFRKLRTAVKDGLSKLEESNLSDYTQQIRDLRASLATLKNTFASAVEPIITTFLPHLIQAVDTLSIMTDKVAQFTAAWTGNTQYIRAIKQSGDAIEYWGKQAEKSLSPLDNLNVITAENNNYFEIADIDQAQIDAVTNLKNLLTETKKLGQKLGSAVVDKLNSIDWKSIQNGADNAATSIANFANGLISIEGLGEAFGTTVAEMLNTATGFADTLVKTFDFTTAGEQFGKSVQTFIDKYKWDKLGETIGRFLRGSIDFAWSMATQIDVDKLSGKLASAISKILGELNKPDKYGVTGWKKLGRFIGALLELILQTIKKIPWLDVAKGMLQALEGVFETNKLELTIALAVITLGSVGKVLIGAGVKTAIQKAITGLFGGGAGAAGAGAAGAGAAGGLSLAGLLAAGALGIVAGFGSKKIDEKLYGTDSDKIWFMDKPIELLDNAWSGIKGWVFSSREEIQELTGYKDGLPFWLDAIWSFTSAGGAYDKLVRTPAELLGNLWDKVKGFFDPFSAQNLQKSASLITQTADDTANSVEASGTRINKALTSVIERFRELAGIDSKKLEEVNKELEHVNVLNNTKNEQAFLNTLKTGSTDLTKVAGSIGVNIADTFTNSTVNALDQNRKTLTQAWNVMAQDARDAFKIKSPSRVFAEIGEYIDLGLAQGITSEQAAVEKAMSGMLSKTGVTIPSIATGAVVPQSKAFASAMSGSSTTQSSLVDALQRVLSPISNGQGINAQGTQEIVLNLDGREFMRAMVKQNRDYKKQHGGTSAFA